MQLDRNTLRRLALIAGALLILAASVMASQTKTVTITNDPNIDMNYTSKIPLTFSNGQFILNNSIRIIPIISVKDKQYNLTSFAGLQSTSGIRNQLYKREWGVNVTKPTIISAKGFDWAGFSIPNGCTKYDDVTMHCGGIEISFSDLLIQNYTVTLSDTFVNITNLGTGNLVLDPTDTLIPNNVTNKAWKNSSSQIDNCYIDSWETTTEFTTAEYNQVNISDNSWFTLGATPSSFVNKCTMANFSFNISSVVAELGTITSMTFAYEGYTTNNYDSFGDLWYYNATSDAWTFIDYIPYGSDGIITKTFTSTNILSNGIATFGLKVHCIFRSAISTKTDIVYLNVTTSGGETPTPITPEGDSWSCNINPYWGDASKSMPILCSAHSNTTGQPITGATVTCTVHSSPYFASTTQAVQTCTKQGNGMYNCTFLTANMAANTPYIINCSCAINGVTNWYMGSTYIMQAYYTNYATSTDVTNILNAITATNSSLAALLATLQAEVISVNTTQNSNYATLQVGILNTNTTQNSNYAAMTTLLNQLGINITSTNTTQNANANNIIALLNAIGLNVTSVNQTMLDNFSTIYTITVQINGTVNGIKVDLAQMNGTLNTMSSNLGAMNTTIVDTQTKLEDNYALLQALAINVTEHNSTLTSYYGSLLASMQDMNTTLRGVGANVTLANSSIQAILSLMASNQTEMNATVMASFLAVYSDLQQMNGTLNNIDARVITLGADLADMNTTLVATQAKLDDTYNLLVVANSSIGILNSSIATYYGNLMTGLQGMNTTLNGVALNITLANGTIVSLVSQVGANLSDLNASTIANFNDVFLRLQGMNTTIVGISATVNGIGVNLTAMNASIMAEFLTLHAEILSVNQTCIGISNDVAAARAVINSMAFNLTGMNTSFLAQFSSLSSQLYDISLDLGDINNSIILVQASLSDINGSMAGNFTNVTAWLAIIDSDLATLNISLGNVTSNLTAAQVAVAVWGYSHKTLTPLNPTVLTLTSNPGWLLPKGYAPTLSCSSNQNESNFTLYFDGVAVTNPYTYAPSQGSYEVRCESPASTNYSAGTSVAYLNISLGGSGGTGENATTNASSALIAATTAQTAPTGWIEVIFIVIPTTAYRFLQITLLGVGLWAYFLVGFVVIFLISIASKREVKSLMDVPTYGMAAFLLALVIFVVYIVVPLAVR